MYITVVTFLSGYYATCNYIYFYEYRNKNIICIPSQKLPRFIFFITSKSEPGLISAELPLPLDWRPKIPDARSGRRDQRPSTYHQQIVIRELALFPRNRFARHFLAHTHPRWEKEPSGKAFALNPVQCGDHLERKSGKDVSFVCEWMFRGLTALYGGRKFDLFCF